jgi:flagellar motility protein MotE (MotC chaperone)
MKKIPFKKINIFTILMVVCVFAFVMRMFNIAEFSTPASVAESTAPSEKFEKVAANDTPKAEEHKPDATPANTPDHKEGDAAADAKAPPASDLAPPPPPSYGEPSFSASEIEVLQDLSKRREELDKREQDVNRKEALLKAAEGEVDRKVAELNKMKGELETLLNSQKTAEDAQVNSLVKIYENMKPKDAARIFDTLEMNVLLDVIGRMKEQKTSPILANMNPDKARDVTIKLAEQRKLPAASTKKEMPKTEAAPVVAPKP